MHILGLTDKNIKYECFKYKIYTSTIFFDVMISVDSISYNFTSWSYAYCFHVIEPMQFLGLPDKNIKYECFKYKIYTSTIFFDVMISVDSISYNLTSWSYAYCYATVS